MDEFFRELQEDMRAERLNRLWKRYGGMLLCVCAAAVLGTAAAVGWRHYQAGENGKRTAALMAATKAAEPGKTAGALDALKGAQRPIAAVAKLYAAADLAKAGKREDAKAIYQALAQDSRAEPALRDLGRTLALSLGAESAKAPEKTTAFYFTETELHAWQALAKGDAAAAAQTFSTLKDAAFVPPGMQARAERIAAHLSADAATPSTVE